MKNSKALHPTKILILFSFTFIYFVFTGCFNQDKIADALYGTLRKPINPTSEWGKAFSFNQAELIIGTTKTLFISGQGAIEEDTSAELGVRVVHEGDIRSQIEFALSNIDEILSLANMDRADIAHLRFYTTDMEAFLANYDAYQQWIESAGIMPTQSTLGVSSLAIPGMMIEIEATAVD